MTTKGTVMNSRPQTTGDTPWLKAAHPWMVGPSCYFGSGVQHRVPITTSMPTRDPDTTLSTTQRGGA